MSGLLDKLLCLIFGHYYDAYRWSPPRCMNCGKRLAGGSHD